MKKRKDRWVGISQKARRAYILARHKLQFKQWCTVVQARINMAKSRLDKKLLSVPKELKGLPVIPAQSYVPKPGFFGRIFDWFKELFTPAKKLPVN